jgi:hypothetical protein
LRFLATTLVYDDIPKFREMHAGHNGVTTWSFGVAIGDGEKVARRFFPVTLI